MKNSYAIIVAAGSGSRFGAELPKQFLCIDGIPIFIHTIRKFLSSQYNFKILLVVNESYSNYVNDIVLKYNLQENVSLIIGGKTRAESVSNALNSIENNGIVLIHDAARPFVSTILIDTIYEKTQIENAVIPILPVTDSLLDKNFETVNREEYYTVQTPQGFDLELLKKAHAQNQNENISDDASVVRALGLKVHTIQGESSNIKITYNDEITQKIVDEFK